MLRPITSCLALAIIGVAFAARHQDVLRRMAHETDGNEKFLAVLLRTGKPGVSQQRVRSIRKTWGRDLEDGALILLQSDDECKKKHGDNHEEGLSCLEAKNHVRLMKRKDFKWLLVVDDDTYVFVDRLRNTLKLFDAGKAAAYGDPYCGYCDADKKTDEKLRGFCGGGGYVVSRQSLLKMGDVSDGNVSSDKAAAFLQHFMKKPNAEWCDVRFGCVARERGLELVGVKGMYGNGIIDGAGKYDEKKEAQIVALKDDDPPMVIHRVSNATHMSRVYEGAKALEKGKRQGGYVAKETAGLKKWILLQQMSNM